MVYPIQEYICELCCAPYPSYAEAEACEWKDELVKEQQR